MGNNIFVTACCGIFHVMFRLNGFRALRRRQWSLGRTPSADHPPRAGLATAPLVEIAQGAGRQRLLAFLPRKVPSIGETSQKLTFIGWKVVASAPPVMWPSRAPIAVVDGGAAGARPNRSAAANRPVISPTAAFRHSPRSP